MPTTPMTKSIRDRLGAFVWTRAARFAQWLAEHANDRLVDYGLAALQDDDPIIAVLHRALGNHTGKLRVADAYLLCGIQPGTASLDQIKRFGIAMRELGWQRMRRRFDIGIEYAYVKGTETEREIALSVEYDPHMRSVRIEIDKN